MRLIDKRLRSYGWWVTPVLKWKIWEVFTKNSSICETLIVTFLKMVLCLK